MRKVKQSREGLETVAWGSEWTEMSCCAHCRVLSENGQALLTTSKVMFAAQ